MGRFAALTKLFRAMQRPGGCGCDWIVKWSVKLRVGKCEVLRGEQLHAA